MDSNIILRPEQEEALERLHSGALLLGGTGSGKTLTSLAFYLKKYKDYKLYVITTARKRDEKDWEAEAKKLGVHIFKVDSWNNIEKYVQVHQCFFIFDEQRAVGYGTWGKSFIKISRNNYWIMLSATPGDRRIDFMPLFVANGYYRNKTDFVRQHVIYNPFVNFPQIKKYNNTGKLTKIRNEVVVPMPVKRDTVRHNKYIKLTSDLEYYNLVKNTRFDEKENKPIENVSELMSVLRKEVNSTNERVECAEFLISTIPRVIVFYNFDYELYILREICNKFKLTKAEWNGHKHEPIPNTKTWVYLVQYTAGAEAWNCIETDTIIFYSLNYSYKTMEQASGRIDRINTPYKDLYYYYLYVKGSIDENILKSIKNKRDFNAKTWIKREGILF